MSELTEIKMEPEIEDSLALRVSNWDVLTQWGKFILLQDIERLQYNLKKRVKGETE